MKDSTISCGLYLKKIRAMISACDDTCIFLRSCIGGDYRYINHSPTMVNIHESGTVSLIQKKCANKAHICCNKSRKTMSKRRFRDIKCTALVSMIEERIQDDKLILNWKKSTTLVALSFIDLRKLMHQPFRPPLS